MRIIIDIREGTDAKGKRAVCVKTGWYSSGKDCARVRNCGVEIYNALKDGFTDGFIGGHVVHDGERK